MRLKHRVTIQQDNGSADAAGQVVPSWSDYRECFALVKDVRGGEQLRGSQVEHRGQVTIEIMYPRDGRFPRVKDRVQYREAGVTRTLNINDIKRMDGDKRRLELHCVEVR